MAVAILRPAIPAQTRHAFTSQGREGIDTLPKGIGGILGITLGLVASCTTCAFADPIQLNNNVCNLVLDTKPKTEPQVPKPGYLHSYVDPVFGTKVTRITGDPGTAIPNVGSTWGKVSRPGYEDRAAWNADQTILLLENTAAGPLLLDGNNYKPLAAENLGPFYSSEARWHPALPSKMLYLGNNARGTACEFGLWDIYTSSITVQQTISGYTGCNLGGTGNWSSDATMVAVEATRSSDKKLVAFALNLATGKKYADIDLLASGFLAGTIDWVSISRSGDLIYVNGGLANGTNRSDNAAIFDLSGNVIQKWLEYGSPSHSDLSVDSNGNEVVVGVDKSSTYLGKIIMRNMRTGIRTPLDTGGFPSLVSARNNTLANFAFVNDTGSKSPNYWPPYFDEIFAVTLDGSKRTPRLAHAHSNWVNYDSQGFVVPSPDGLRFVFASDWKQPSGLPVQTYVADMRGLCSPGSLKEK
ncbi:MAG: hypothetical protein J2P49_04505 [Methylocapsa sp.]|nr:hypothetical protein [Methylocapsa sp.]